MLSEILPATCVTGNLVNVKGETSVIATIADFKVSALAKANRALFKLIHEIPVDWRKRSGNDGAGSKFFLSARFG